jgi:hypothetical protein
MPFKAMNVVVAAMVPVQGTETDPHPEHPIYIPIDPPPDSGLSPEHPIYIPVVPPEIWGGVPPEYVDIGLPEPQPTPEHPIYIPVPPPPDSDLSPEHPIYIPVYPEHPIVLPPESGLSDEQKEKLRGFLFGNLPPFAAPHR